MVAVPQGVAATGQWLLLSSCLAAAAASTWAAPAPVPALSRLLKQAEGYLLFAPSLFASKRSCVSALAASAAA